MCNEDSFNTARFYFLLAVLAAVPTARWACMVFYIGDALRLWSVQRLVQYIIEEHSKEANVLALAPIRENMRESKPSKRLQEHLIRGYLSLQHRSCKVRRACAVAEKQCTECARHLRPQACAI